MIVMEWLKEVEVDPETCSYIPSIAMRFKMWSYKQTAST